MSAEAERQPDLFGPTAPPGFRYAPDLISETEADALVEQLDRMALQPFEFQGRLANRQVASFGFRYDYGRRSLLEAPPIPDWLAGLRDRAAAFAGLSAEAFAHALVNAYPPGAGIEPGDDDVVLNYHHFSVVVGVSLLAPCMLRFRRRRGASWERRSVVVEPRSAYLLAGEARAGWQHSISPMDRRRYSITFRSMAKEAQSR